MSAYTVVEMQTSTRCPPAAPGPVFVLDKRLLESTARLLFKAKELPPSGRTEYELEARLQLPRGSLEAEVARRRLLDAGFSETRRSDTEVRIYDAADLRVVKNLQTGAELWQKKKTLSSLKVPSEKYPDVKLALSEETAADKKLVDFVLGREYRPKLTRRKRTWWLSFPEAGPSPYRAVAHVSSVQERRERGTEVEVEFYPTDLHEKASAKDLVSGVFRPLKALYRALFVDASRPPGPAQPSRCRPPDHVRRLYDRAVREALGRRSAPKPHTLTRGSVEQVRDCGVTNKLDGVRFLLVLSRGQTPWLHSPPATWAPLAAAGSPSKKWNGEDAVLDGELYEGSLWCFDVLYSSEVRDVARRGLPARLGAMRGLAGRLGALGFPVEEKRFFLEGSIAQRFSQAREHAEGMAERNDGYIFTPMTRGYSAVSWKHKPPHEQTIDFRAVQRDRGRYDLLLGTKEGERAVTFRGSPLQGDVVPTSRVPLQDALFKGAGARPPGKEGAIIEFGYEAAMGWVPRRPRPEKRKPNFVDSAREVWRAVVDPLTDDELQELLEKTSRMDWRSYHSYVKSQLIRKHTTGKDVLDIGIGKGGDLGKYLREGTSRVFGLEPSESHLSELGRRLRGMPEGFRGRVSLLRGSGESLEDIERLLQGSKMDAVASMFSLTFFFKDRTTLDALAENVASSLKDGGVFFGTTMDGKSVAKELSRVRKGTTTCQTAPMCIKKQYSNRDPLLGRKIEVEVKVEKGDRPTIVTGQEEWLVYEPLLTEALSKHGVSLVSWERFPIDERVDPDSRLLTSLQSSFSYVKGAPGKGVDRETLARFVEEVEGYFATPGLSPVPEKGLGSAAEIAEAYLAGTLPARAGSIHGNSVPARARIEILEQNLGALLSCASDKCS